MITVERDSINKAKASGKYVECLINGGCQSKISFIGRVSRESVHVWVCKRRSRPG